MCNVRVHGCVEVRGQLFVVGSSSLWALGVELSFLGMDLDHLDFFFFF